MEDEDEIPTALSSLGADYTPESMRAQWARYESDAAAFAARQRALRQQQMEDGRKRLEAMQYGPSRAEQLFALSAAFAAPQRQRGFAGMMANVMPTLARLAAARQDADLKRNEDLQRLQDQYLSGQMDDEMSGLNARRQALQALTTLAKPQRGRIVTPQPGGGAFEIGDDGSVRTLVVPNDGSQAFGATAGQGSGVQKKVVNGTTYYGVGGKWFDSEEDALRAGGGVGNGTGGFRANVPSGNPLEPPRR